MPNLETKKPRKRQTTQTWKNEELFYTLINTTTEAVIATGENDRIFLFNPSAEILFGRKANELIGKRLDELIPKEYRKKHRRYLKDFFSVSSRQGVTHQVIEIPGLRAGGEEFSMEVSLSSGRSDDRNFLVAVARDISDKKQALAALSASEEKYRTLQEKIRLSLFVSFYVERANHPNCTLGGQFCSPATGRSWPVWSKPGPAREGQLPRFQGSGQFHNGPALLKGFRSPSL